MQNHCDLYPLLGAEHLCDRSMNSRLLHRVFSSNGTVGHDYVISRSHSLQIGQLFDFTPCALLVFMSTKDQTRLS